MTKEEAVFIIIRLLAVLLFVLVLPHVVEAVTQVLFYGFDQQGQQRIMFVMMLVPLAIYPLIIGLLWCKAEKLTALLLKK